MLADEGKLNWDDPATRYLPGFEMYDPYVTRELTVGDLLSHRSALGGGDFLWYGNEYEHWHYNTFRARFPPNALDANAYATFSLNAQGKIENVTLNLMPDYPFKTSVRTGTGHLKRMKDEG